MTVSQQKLRSCVNSGALRHVNFAGISAAAHADMSCLPLLIQLAAYCFFQHHFEASSTAGITPKRQAPFQRLLGNKDIIGIEFIPMPSFEFDPDKSKSNREKHGIDFVQAQKLWEDPNLLEVRAKSADEPRYLLVGIISEQYWSAIATYRVGNIRIISVRRSRQTEVELYES